MLPSVASAQSRHALIFPAQVEEYGVTAVPHFVILKGGDKVSEYVGSKAEDLEAAVSKAVAGGTEEGA